MNYVLKSGDVVMCHAAAGASDGHPGAAAVSAAGTCSEVLIF